MNRTASFTLMLGALLFSFSAAAANDMCQEASRNASKIAQDYRNAVGKMKTACNSTYEECEQSRVQSNEALAQVNAANAAMLTACIFVHPILDDLLPFTPATVQAALDLVPESVAVPCSVVSHAVGDLSIGCPNSWILNIPKSDVTVSGATDTAFNYSVRVNVSARIPVRFELFGFPAMSCNLTVSTSTGVPVTGTATFFSSLPGGYFNRLQMGVDSGETGSLQIDGCGEVGEVLSLFIPLLRSSIEGFVLAALNIPLLCGAIGPELFGSCP